MHTNESHFTESIAACLKNGQRLLDDADWLNYEEHQQSSFVLATIAQEEFAKAFLLFLVSKGVIPWNKAIYQATRDHICKHLLILVMNYVNPYTDDYFDKHEQWRAAHEEIMRLLETCKMSSDFDERKELLAQVQEMSAKLDSVPKSIADAICILRYKRLDRSTNWVWPEGHVWDEIAKSIGNGELDRAKQDALYVRLGKDGRIANAPAPQIDANAAIETAKNLAWLAKGFLSGGVSSSEYKKVESTFKAVFENFQSYAATSA